MDRGGCLLAVLGLTLLCRTSWACSILELSEAGLAANVNKLWYSLPAFYGFNGSVFLDNTKFAYKCEEDGGWTDFFVPETGFLQPWSAPLAEQHSCAYWEYSHMHELSSQLGLEYGCARYDPAIVRKVWRLQPHVQKEVNTALAQLRSYPGPTIAFHVRGGDKAKEDQALGRETIHPVDLVSTFLDNYGHIRGGTCVLVGDDEKALEEMIHLVKEHIGCEVTRGSTYYRREGHHQETFNNQPLHERCKATKELIKDIELMAHADYYVGALTSGLASVVETLRIALYEKSQYTIADATQYDMGNRVRRFYGIGGWGNVTIGSPKPERKAEPASSRKHSRLLKNFL